jgi:hypothetical protein
MQQHPTVMQNQPNYGHMTAWRDWGVIRKDLIERRDEVAADYIASQLETVDELLDQLEQDFKDLSDIDYNEIEDEAVRARLMVDSFRTKKDIVAAIDRLLGRQQTLVPIGIPKQLKIDSTHTSYNLDRLLELKKQALELAEGDVIEGEIVD